MVCFVPVSSECVRRLSDAVCPLPYESVLGAVCSLLLVVCVFFSVDHTQPHAQVSGPSCCCSCFATCTSTSCSYIHSIVTTTLYSWFYILHARIARWLPHYNYIPMSRGAAWLVYSTAYHSGLSLWLPLRELPCALRIDMLIVSILRLISLFSTSCFCVDSCCLYIAYTMAKLFSFCSFAYAF